MKALNDLLEMLTYKRPSRSKTELEFIEKYLVPLGAKSDVYGNMILRIGQAPVLWSSHTDTVHSTSGKQELVTGPDKEEFWSVSLKEQKECLGADDTTGVWIMCQMAKEGVEGLYVWHREEESGAHGSSYIALHTPELVEDIKYAIAFDRAYYDSIITHQMSYRTASDEFADSLAEQLGLMNPNGDLAMKADDGGIFTDTENYAELIPECSNVSVGYSRAHSGWEQQDLGFALLIMEAMCGVDIDELVCARKPGEHQYKDAWPYGGKGWWSDSDYKWTDDYDKPYKQLTSGPDSKNGEVPAGYCEWCEEKVDLSYYIWQGYRICSGCHDYIEQAEDELNDSYTNGKQVCTHDYTERDPVDLPVPYMESTDPYRVVLD